MKKILLSLLLIGFAGLYSAQDIAIFLEDFEGPEDVLGEAVVIPFDADDDEWINYDSDAIAPSAADTPGNFYLSEDVKYLQEEYDGDTNLVAYSTSWLTGFAPENRNYLILPEIEITAEAFLLFWKSGARQGPRYTDGYSVGIVTDAGIPEDNFVQMWSGAQFVGDDNTWHPDLYGPEYDFTGCPIPSEPILEQDLSSVCYYPEVGDGTAGTGYVHGENFTNMDVLGIQDNDESNTAFICKLEQHELSLEDYIGETVRICFLHDSDDDNGLMLDDIMVASGLNVGIAELEFSDFISMYPNPVNDVLNFNFSRQIKDNAVINVIDTKGAIVYSEVVNNASLRNTFSIDLNDYSAGLYSISVTIDNSQTVTESIIKR